MEFARPHLFWLFLIYIPLIFWYVYKIRKIDPTIQASTLDAVKNFRTSGYATDCLPCGCSPSAASS